MVPFAVNWHNVVDSLLRKLNGHMEDCLNTLHVNCNDIYMQWWTASKYNNTYSWLIIHRSSVIKSTLKAKSNAGEQFLFSQQDWLNHKACFPRFLSKFVYTFWNSNSPPGKPSSSRLSCKSTTRSCKTRYRISETWFRFVIALSNNYDIWKRAAS